MKNILLLTSVYPANDLPKDHTPVVHYFAKEWVKQGYNVMVIHNIVFFPWIIHFLSKIFKNVISKHYNFPFPTKKFSKEKDYYIDNVRVHRIPIFKKFPQSLFSLKTENKQIERIIKLIDINCFNPDAVIGHWANPQLNQVSQIGKRYNSKTCIVLHNDVEIIRRVYGKNYASIIHSIDVWGFRSNNIKNKFERLYGKVNKTFFCYSGIPDNNINPPSRTFANGIQGFLFTGLLIPRKYPTALVMAINETFEKKEFHISFIGQGPEKDKIKRLAKKFDIKTNISFFGRIQRKEVFKIMSETDCFVMISSPETLGLVYIEAMSMGCITIGSKNEGIDGIIQHGVNGFLCKAGDHKELSQVFKNISELSREKLITISKNAISTASNLTDSKVAKHYIRTVLDS